MHFQKKSIHGQYSRHVARRARMGPEGEVATGIALERLGRRLAGQAENMECDGNEVWQRKHQETVLIGVDEGLDCLDYGGCGGA